MKIRYGAETVPCAIPINAAQSTFGDVLQADEGKFRASSSICQPYHHDQQQKKHDNT